MTHGSLFSGIGGFDLAAEWCGWHNAFQVEIDPFCQRVLQKNFPDARRFSDIRAFDGSKFHESIDVLSGGFPCQPYSTAGQRRGASDDRALWPEMLRVVGEIQPTWVIGENVVGIKSMGLENMLSDLEALGYKAATLVIPACAVGAAHRRDRVWILAYADQKRITQSMVNEANFQGLPFPAAENVFSIAKSWDERETNTPRNGGAHGLSAELDRIGALGNAIVPQVAYQIFKSINDFHFPQPQAHTHP